MFRKKGDLKIVLALGGGGSRGLAHLGVIKALLENGIPISGIAGTSMGSIIGAMYCETLDIDLMYERVHSYLNSRKFREFHEDFLEGHQKEDFWSQLFERFKKQVAVNLALQKISLGDAGELFNALDNLIGVKYFKDLQLPFLCVADDLKTGKKVIQKEGRLKPALAGSSAIPGFLPPVEYEGYLLCDGMLTSVIPTLEAREIGSFVIGVDVRQDIPYVDGFGSAIDVLIRAELITSDFRSEILGRQADFLISPDVGKYLWNDFSNWQGLIDEGYRATVEKLPGLIDKLEEKRSWILRYGYDPVYRLVKKITGRK